MERVARLSSSRVYIRRQGRMTRAQARALATLWPRYRIEPTLAPIDWSQSFGRTGPLFVEIGFGMGHTLLATARAHPEWNCVGIEVYRPGIGAVLNAIDAERLGNVRIIEGDARVVFANMIAEGSLHRVAIYFPDPWPKSKHHKRRLVNGEFVALVANRLRQGAELHLATDWRDYAEEMRAVLDAEPALENLAGTGAFAPRDEDRPTTRFEARGTRLGHAVWDFAYRRR
jgi:tRNA (guanine-N7-)-methyltransferase